MLNNIQPHIETIELVSVLSTLLIMITTGGSVNLALLCLEYISNAC